MTAALLASLHRSEHQCQIAVQVLKISPLHKPTLLAFAQLWLTVSRPQDAVGIAKRAVEHDPADQATHHILGKCYR